MLNKNLLYQLVQLDIFKKVSFLARIILIQIYLFIRTSSGDKPSNTNGDRSSRQPGSGRQPDSQQVNAKNPNVADIPNTENVDPKRATTKGLQRVRKLIYLNGRTCQMKKLGMPK